MGHELRVWMLVTKEKIKNSTSHTPSREHKTTQGTILLLLENNFHLNRKKDLFASSK